MKRYLCIAIVAALVFLVGCSGPTEPSLSSPSSSSSQTSQEPAPSGEAPSSQSGPDILLQAKNFQLEEVSNFVPTVRDGKALFSDPYPLFRELSKNTLELDVSTGNITTLDFFLPYPSADDSYYYGIPLEDKADPNSGQSIVRIRKGTEEPQVLYTIGANRAFLPLLTYDNGYLLWTEEVFDEDNTFLYWEIFSLNCATLEVNLITETNYIYTYYYVLPASHGYLPVCKELDFGYKIEVYEVKSGQVVVEHKIKGPTYALCCDGSILAWTELTPAVYNDALKVLSLESGEERTVKKSAGAVDVKIYKNNYLVYMQENKIKVYNRLSDTVIYDSTNDDNLGDIFTMAWFSMDAQGGVAAFISDSTINNDIYYLTILPLYELNG